MKRRLPVITASVFALFHFVTVVLTLVISRGSGEGQAFLVALLDVPLLLLLQAVPGGDRILYGSSTAYVWFFSIAGTLMYAAGGYCVGALLKWLFAKRTPDARSPDLRNV